MTASFVFFRSMIHTQCVSVLRAEMVLEYNLLPIIVSEGHFSPTKPGVGYINW